jgi:hypothetical protein
MALSIVSVEIDGKTLDEVKFMLATVKNGAANALRLAANDTAKAAQTRIVKTIATRIQLSQKRIRKDTGVFKANRGQTTAYTYILNKFLPLKDFPHTVRARGGINVGIRKGDPRELFRHMFKATMASGHIGIWERRKFPSGKIAGRLPIEERYGPRMGEVFHANDEKKVFDEMMILFQERLLQKAVFLLNKA